MAITKEQALCLVAYRSLKRWRQTTEGVTAKVTNPIFRRIRAAMSVEKGQTKFLNKCVCTYDIEQVLTKKEIAEMRARIKAEVLLTK